MGERTSETWESFDTLEQATKFYKDNVFVGTFTEPTKCNKQALLANY